MSEKILFVDDESAVLQGYERLLRKEIQLSTAVGGTVALAMIRKQGPFAVVVSDMRMPGMDGVEFLHRVRTLAPDTVRIMLTGASDQQTAIGAVNEGCIFRFLSKPCEKDVLLKILNDAVAQYKLVSTERDLLEKTLRGTVYVLTEVLSLVSPAAFSRATRVRRYVQHIANRLSLGNPWKLEVAAMMAQLGCVTLDPNTIESVYAGRDLSPEEEGQYVNHPLITQELLKNIPRLESIAWMIAYQNRPLPADWDMSNREMKETRLGAQILRAALAFDFQLRKNPSRVEAAHMLTRKFEDLDPRIIEALLELSPELAGASQSKVPIADLVAGMILEQELRTSAGLLVVAKGQEITTPLLLKIKSLLGTGSIAGEVDVSRATAPLPAAVDNLAQ